MASKQRERLPDGTYMHLLYPERARRLIEGCRSGLFDSQNALREGIDPNTLKGWVERGLDENAEEPFLSFAEGYIKASIELEERVLARVLAAAEDFEGSERSVEVTKREGGSSQYDDGFVAAGEEVFRKTKTGRSLQRGDWRAAAWFAERRWPLRWGITRQPEGGPKEALKLPDAAVNRVRMLRERLVPPPPELIKLYREAGYELVPTAERLPTEKAPG